MKKITPIFFFLSLLCTAAFAQDKTIDSLLHVIKTAKPDTNKINNLNIVGKYYGENSDSINMLRYVAPAIELSNKLSFNKGLAQAYRTLGVFYYHQSMFALALENHTKALKNYEIINDRLGISACYNNIGLAYVVGQANYPKALACYLKALKIKEEIKDEKGMYRSYMNIGEVYYFQNNQLLTLRYYFTALRIAQKLKNETMISDCYMNIGVAYEEHGEFKKSLEYNTKALASKEKLNEKLKIGKCLGNIGNIYYYLHDFKKALDFQLRSLVLKEEENDKPSISDCLTNIGEIYLMQGNYPKALESYMTALKIKQEIKDNNGLRTCYLGLAEINSKLKNYKDAYEYQVKFKKINDTLFNTENSRQLSDLKTNFAVEKNATELKIKSEVEKEKLRSITKQEKKVQQIITAAVVGVLLIVLIFSFFLFKRFKLTNKQKQIIELKNEETEAQKYLIEEKQKEIISSITYAKRLQNAILPAPDFINKYVPDNFVLYKPKDIVAGDFYWMYVNNDLIFMAAADSTGHGVPGALVSIVCSNALDKAVKEFGLTDTGKILDKTTDLVLETFDKSGEEIKDGMDISLICFDKKNKKIFWSGANNQLLYITENGINSVKADKQPVGKSDHRKPFTTNKIDYTEGTLFYLMTDGFADQFGGPKGKKFMFKKLEEKIVRISSESLPLQKTILEETFKSWKGDLEQLDDVTIIAIKI